MVRLRDEVDRVFRLLRGKTPLHQDPIKQTTIHDIHVCNFASPKYLQTSAQYCRIASRWVLSARPERQSLQSAYCWRLHIHVPTTPPTPTNGTFNVGAIRWYAAVSMLFRCTSDRIACFIPSEGSLK